MQGEPRTGATVRDEAVDPTMGIEREEVSYCCKRVVGQTGKKPGTDPTRE